MMWRRNFRMGLLGQEVPGVIKRITPAQLSELSVAAQAAGYTATGRPKWTGQHQERIKSVVLMPLGLEGTFEKRSTCWRCYAGVMTENSGLVVFTLDVEKQQLLKLDTIKEPWELAELWLYWAEHLPVEVENR